MLALVTTAAALGVAAMSLGRGPVHAAKGDGVSLLQTLAEWQYPGSRLAGGATMSDGGNPTLQSVKCRAVLTTPDTIEDVITFYSEKFSPDAKANAKDGKAPARSVADQDDSLGRSVTVRVFVANTADTATTLVISRADGEKQTHIAWLHYLRLGDNR
jgi:hypothetical protein